MFVVAGGSIIAEVVGDHERHRLRQMLEGIAPTYAAEIERLNHAQFRLDIPADNATYLSLGLHHPCEPDLWLNGKSELLLLPLDGNFKRRYR